MTSDSLVRSDAPVQYSVGKLLLLHLLPGLLATALYLMIASALVSHGISPLFGLVFCLTFVLVIFEGGHLCLLGYRRNGRLSLEGIVLYRTPLPRKKVFFTVVLLTLLAILTLTLTAPLDALLIKTAFRWLPSWFFYGDLSQYRRLDRSTLQLLCVLRLLLDGFVLPVIEEFYFRGYLLPKMERFGKMAPVWNHLLFSLYHFWQPYNLPTLLTLFPMTWTAWKKQSLAISLWTHISLNLLGSILFYMMLMSGTR